MHTVWTVTYLDEYDHSQMLIFDNPLAAYACRRYFYNIYRGDVRVDQYTVYGSFMTAGNGGDTDVEP